MAHGDLPLFYVFIFYFFGLLAIGAAVLFVTRKSPVSAALWLVVTMFCLAALYVLQDAQFIGIIQVLVYAGAIMVVFLFVIMLLNLGHPTDIADARGHGWKLVAGLVGLALLAEVANVVRAHLPTSIQLPPNFTDQQVAAQGVIAPLAAPLFHEYLLAFEVTSVLLLAAVVGAVVLGKRRSTDDVA